MNKLDLMPKCKADSTLEKSVKVIYLINRIRRKNYMTIPIDVGKSFDKMQHSLIILRKNHLAE